MDQKLSMGKKMAPGVFNRRVHPINNANANANALPDDAVFLQPPPLAVQPPPHSSKWGGVSCVGLRPWGIRRKVHFVSRAPHTLPRLPAPPPPLTVKPEPQTMAITRSFKRACKPTEKVKKKVKLSDSPKRITNGTVERWSLKRYTSAELKLLDIMKEKGAVLGTPILRHILRSEARKHIGDTGLLDHLLKHMVGKVYKERRERFCRRHNSQGHMEFWLERDDLAELRKLAGVTDPYWIPPPGWKLGNSPYQDASTGELKKLNEELNNLKRLLKQFLLEDGEKEEEENFKSLIKYSHVVSGTTKTLERKKTSHCDNITVFRWTKERYETAELKLLEIMREKKAFLGNPISRGDLRTLARHHVGDTGLLDHLLKHMVGKVFGDREERLCRHRNVVGAMEYWLENANMIELRRQAGVKDPFWVPPPGWEPGDIPYNYVESCKSINQLKSEISDVRRELVLLLTKGNGSEVEANVEEIIDELSTSFQRGGNQLPYTATKDKWPKKRYVEAESLILDIMRRNGASLTNPILQSSLRVEAAKCIRDMILVDYLLQNMPGKVYEERGERFCIGYDVKGSVMCWLDSTNGVGYVEDARTGFCDDDSLGNHNDNSSKLSRTSGQCNLLKEEMEMHDLAMRLEMLPMDKYSCEQDLMVECFHKDADLTSLEEANMSLGSCNNSFLALSKESFKAAELKLLEVTKEKRAVLGNAIPEPILRSEAFKHINNTDVLDHLMDHMVGKVYEETGERPCHKKNLDGTVEYWLESSYLVGIKTNKTIANGELQMADGEIGGINRSMHINHLQMKEFDDDMDWNTLYLSSGSGTSKSSPFEVSTNIKDLNLDFPSSLILDDESEHDEWGWISTRLVNCYDFIF